MSKSNSKIKKYKKKSRQLIDKERWAESQTDAYEFLYSTPQTVREWFIRMIAYTIGVTILGLLVMNIHTFVGEMILILPICTAVFVGHELTHILVTKILGYKIEWYPINIIKIPFTKRNILMQGFDVTFPSRTSLIKHRWVIGIAPYCIVFPLCAVFLLSPSLTLKLSGIILLGTHLFGLRYEARKA